MSIPWSNPRAGDRCVNNNGRERTVVRRLTSPFNKPPFESENGYTIVYRVNSGREMQCWINTWEAWCRMAIRHGGTYYRDE